MADAFESANDPTKLSLNRRDLLKWAGALGLASTGIFSELLTRQKVLAAAMGTFSSIRPPATPLIVRSPYVSTWLAGDNLPGTWPTFWNGNVKAITGIARIDNTPYVFMGAPANVGSPMTQTNLQVTATQSIYTLQAGGITLTLTFLSPIEPNDIQRQSIPLSYIFAQAQSNDGNTHTVSLYFDISGEWAHSDTSQQVNWSRNTVSHSGGTLTSMSFALVTPTVLAENNDYNTWGYPVWATATTSNLTTQIGADAVVRGAAASNGVLNGAIDTNAPRAINNMWPVLGFNFALGSVGTSATAPVELVLGHVRTPAVSYLGQSLNGLWQAYWSNSDQMLAFFYDDAVGARVRGNDFDNQIITDATAIGGSNYAAICSLAARQAFAGTELINGPGNTPWLFLKEISSSGNVSTVDVVYPSFPIILYTSPALLNLLLAPIIAYCESGHWPSLYCVHDLGASYPNASGHNDGGGENMQVEETANMLIMAATYVNNADASTAAAYANQHYNLFRQWANYLNAPNGGNPSRPNALDPLLQNQTDDFTGFIAHGTNLALKGILGIAAMGIIANVAGNAADALSYHNTATALIPQWVSLAEDPGNQHQMIAYNESDTLSGTGVGSWSLKYNSYPDKALGLNIVPGSTLQQEVSWYTGQEHTYGVPLDSRHTYTKTDWELWVAAGMGNATFTQYIINAVYAFANTSPSRVPFTDWYDTQSDQQVGFQARPVIGGLYTLMTLSLGAGKLAGYWPFDENTGTTAFDVTGHGNIGTLQGGAGWAAGHASRSALSLNGSGAYVDVPVTVVNTMQSYSVAAWVNLSNTNGFHTVVSIDGTNISGFFLQYSASDGKFAFSVLTADSNTAGVVRAVATSAPTTGQWYHLVGIYNASAHQIALYVNGVLQSAQPYANAWQATGHTVIGRGKFGGGPVDFFPGSIDEVYLYNRVLSQQEITTLAAGAATGLVGDWAFNEGSGTTSRDGSGGGKTTTLQGGAGWAGGHVGPSAISLNGTTAYADVPVAVVNTSQSYAVAAWVNLSNTSGFHTVVSIDGTNVSGFFLQYSGADGVFAMSVIASDSNSAAGTRALATTAPAAGQWYHLVGMYDASAHEISLYVNGKLQSTRSFTTAWQATGHTVIGRGKFNGGPVDFTPGSIDDVRLFARTLTLHEIVTLAQG